MTRINVYIGFNGKCREAMTFYKECLGGELELQTVAGSPIENHCPVEMKDHIMHSSLTRNGVLMLMGTDMTAPGGYVNENSVACNLNCSSEEEINTFYKLLSEGGHIIDPLGVKFWGAIFGVFTDKFGIGWMLHFDPKANNL